MSRPDVVLRRRSDGSLFIKNFKTVSNPDARWAEQWRYDMQTLSECLAVEEWLSLPQLSWAGTSIRRDVPRQKLSGVLIEGLAKGTRLEYPKGSGNWYHNSPLTQCWMKQAAAPFPAEFAARYEWADASGLHRLGRGWRKVPVWNSYPGGVKAWVLHLVETDIALVEEQFYPVPAILRSDWEIEEWKQMTLPAEIGIHQNSAGDPLNVFFPKHSAHGNCIRPSRCNFHGICWGNDSPDDTTLYQIRTLNHPTEEQQ